MNMPLILKTLTDLENNNNRAWYHQNKAQRQQATESFEQLILELNLRLQRFDSSLPLHDAKSVTFKMVRDLRFSKNKEPYYPAFRAHLGPQGKQPIPVGYFVHIQPKGSFLGGGLFADVFQEATAMIRQHINDHPQEWLKLLNQTEFRNQFEVKGTALKKVPTAYDPNHPLAELLKHKSWYLEFPISDGNLLDANQFLDTAEIIFEQMMPFNQLLNEALINFKMPER